MIVDFPKVTNWIDGIQAVKNPISGYHKLFLYDTEKTNI